MKEAMKKIREDFGPEAVILDSNPIRSKGLGGLFKQAVEVVAAYDPTVGRKPEPAPQIAQKPVEAAQTKPEKPLRVVHPAAAKYAAAARLEPGYSVEAAEPAMPTQLEPVIFPALEIPEYLKPLLESMQESEQLQQPVRRPEPEYAPEPEPIPEPVRGPEPEFMQESISRPDFEYILEAVRTPAPRRSTEPECISEAARRPRTECSPEPERVQGPQPQPEPLYRQEEEPPAKKAQSSALVQFETEKDPLSDQIASLKDAVQDFTQRISLMTKDTALTLPPDILNLYRNLIERDIPEDMARELAVQTQLAQNRRQVKAETAAQQIIMDKLGETAPIKLKAYRQNVLFFVGPTGAGKTTTLVKLAGMLAIEHKLRVGVVNMDTYRIGAMEHMRIYTDIMDIPLQTAYSAAELSQALETLADRDVVLVDTAGKSTGDDGYRQEIAECLKAAKADEVFLVLSVAMGHRASREIIQNYAFLSDYKLIVTKLDEVSAWGNVLYIREMAGKPLAYMAVGQNVPDDIRPADTKRLADNIVGKKVSVI